jgi:hypothetical protein
MAGNVEASLRMTVIRWVGTVRVVVASFGGTYNLSVTL